MGVGGREEGKRERGTEVSTGYSDKQRGETKSILPRGDQARRVLKDGQKFIILMVGIRQEGRTGVMV